MNKKPSTATQDLRREKYQLQADILTAVAHPIRVAIVDLLKDGEVCVCEIAERIHTERSNTSRHLAMMLKAGVLKTRKDGQQVFYSLRTPCVVQFLQCACQALEQNLSQQSRALSGS
jgi:ArsR family transcriptional regulator